MAMALFPLSENLSGQNIVPYKILAYYIEKWPICSLPDLEIPDCITCKQYTISLKTFYGKSLSLRAFLSYLCLDILLLNEIAFLLHVILEFRVLPK